MVPVSGCFPSLQASSSASIELRDGGMIMEPWAETDASVAAAVNERKRIVIPAVDVLDGGVTRPRARQCRRLDETPAGGAKNPCM